jgi:hypothetical protein
MIAVKLWSLNQMRFAPLFGQINVGGGKDSNVLLVQCYIQVSMINTVILDGF